MDRDSILYKVRRRIQVLAYHIIPKEQLSKFYYKIVLKKKLDLNDPTTFNEKLQWLKLNYYPQNPLAVKCTDKYSVRDHLENKGLAHLLVPLLGAWDNETEISFEELPNQFVLKCSHGCAYNIICDDKAQFSSSQAKKTLRKWLREDFGTFNVEPHYSKITTKKIICEEYLGEKLTDYKFFCFHGEPQFIYVSTDLAHDRQAAIGFFDLKGKKLPLHRTDYSDISEIELPRFYEEMLIVAKKLAVDFPFVRVDFFLANERYYFAELTFTPGACMIPLSPESYDLLWGNQLELKDL